jgi:hypothetical protein
LLSSSPSFFAQLKCFSTGRALHHKDYIGTIHARRHI